MNPRNLLAAPLLICCGCSLFGADPPEECSDAVLAELESKFAAELLATCANAPSVAKCPEADKVIAKYDALRKEWTECR